MTPKRPGARQARTAVAVPTDDARVRRLGAIVWPSFFSAGVATTVFFAIVDPVDLAGITWPRLEITRLGGYTIGFFMFWLCTFSACAFTALLVVPPRRRRTERAR